MRVSNTDSIEYLNCAATASARVAVIAGLVTVIALFMLFFNCLRVHMHRPFVYPQHITNVIWNIAKGTSATAAVFGIFALICLKAKTYQEEKSFRVRFSDK